MSNATALRVAIGLVLVPSRGRMLKAEPLPDGGTCCASPLVMGTPRKKLSK
jgi:hypothetical protein